MPLVSWLMAGASLRTRWLVSAVWVSLWAMVYALMTLIPLGAHGYRWWVPIIGASLLIGLAHGSVGGLDRAVRPGELRGGVGRPVRRAASAAVPSVAAWRGAVGPRGAHRRGASARLG